ncbi:MAG: FG-GAP-like repeat-containing protein [Pyrinomonadaceae bacterium]
MKRIALSLVLALGIFPAAVHGASGDRDRSFGVNGVAYADFPEPVSTIAIQADNKVITGGQCYLPTVGHSHFCMMRHLTDGSIDNSFGVQGSVSTIIGVGDSQLKRVLVLPNGKIVAVGYTDYYDPVPWEHNYYGFAVARYNSDGSLDTTFDSDGVWMNTLVGYRGAVAYDVVVQPDGKLIVAGAGTANGTGFIAVRLNVDGSLDTSFAGTGVSITDIGIYGGASCVALQPDGKIVLAGNGSINIDDKYVVVRLTSTGTLDGTFNNSGKLGFAAGATVNDHIRRVAVLPNSKIMVMGSSQYGFGSNFGSYMVVLVRINANGSFDTSFNGTGKVMSNLPGADHANANDFLVQPTGKIIVTGSISLYGNLHSMSARYRTDGTLDPQYGDKGQLRDYTQFESTAVVKQSDGKIIFAGTRFFSYPNDSRAYLERVLDNGTREVDFDNDRKADVAVFRRSTASWYLLKSTEGFAGIGFGAARDHIVPGDYDGDGRIDEAVFRQGNWYLLRSSDGSFSATAFGQSGDIPVAADYDGDGKTDLAVFRQGNWYILNSSDGSFRAEQFGQVGDRPVVGNFDGDLRSDLTVFRGGFWYVNGSTSGFTVTQFGLDSDRPVAADYDSDGKTDLAVYRDGVWYLQQSFAGFSAAQFGIASDRPVPADYDADGRADIAVFRDGVWYELHSTTGFESVFFGSAGDVPVPAAYLP